MNINLREVNSENWFDCTALKVKEEQNFFIATNSFSLAQACYETECIPKCIYDGDTMIGFAMYVFEEEDNELWICRFMIDQNYQGKGYGKAALIKVIELLEKEFPGKEIYLSLEPENVVARKLYENLGFKTTGRIEEGEEVLVRN